MRFENFEESADQNITSTLVKLISGVIASNMLSEIPNNLQIVSGMPANMVQGELGQVLEN